jgi:hypothetical protein
MRLTLTQHSGRSSGTEEGIGNRNVLVPKSTCLLLLFIYLLLTSAVLSCLHTLSSFSTMTKDAMRMPPKYTNENQGKDGTKQGGARPRSATERGKAPEPGHVKSIRPRRIVNRECVALLGRLPADPTPSSKQSRAVGYGASSSTKTPQKRTSSFSRPCRGPP